jgi:hypothetical protein
MDRENLSGAHPENLIGAHGDGHITAATGKAKKKPRGRPFQKGVSGNPRGRPRKTPQANAIVFMPVKFVDRFLRSMYARVPDDAQVVGCTWDSDRKGAVFSILTGAFRAAANGRELPELAPYKMTVSNAR